MQNSWRKDQRIEDLSRALELQDRAGYTNDENLNFQLDRVGITISSPGIRMFFLLNKECLELCADVVKIYERNSRLQRALERERRK